MPIRFGWARCKHFFCCCCFANFNNRFKMRMQTFGKLPYGQTVQLYEIENKHGVVLTVTNYGARIVGLKVPGLNGQFVDVVCGFKTLEEYMEDKFYFGAMAGRVAGRIFPTKIEIDGKFYNLTPNAGDAHLHGGNNGFDKVLWKADLIEEDNGVVGVRLRYTSPAGTEGYPGELVVEVEYRLTNDNEVITHVKAFAEETTIVNIPNHSYFNLGGKDDPTVYDHIVTILADTYIAVDPKTTIPTGEILPVQNTVYDFRKPIRLGEVMSRTPIDGFDDFWCFSEGPSKEPKLAAKLYHPRTGINMDILTTQPGLVMYTGNYLHPAVVGKYGEVLDRHGAMCLETQLHPNAINTPGFPSPIVRSGETYDHTTIWRFSQVKHRESVAPAPETPKQK